MDKRRRATLFRDRLSDAMAREGLNRSSLARAAEVDRSTIGQLLQDGEARLPSGQLLADLAAVLRVSSDWLLGLSERPERPGDLLDALSHLTQRGGTGRPDPESIVTFPVGSTEDGGTVDLPAWR
jgi:transcriptional regulator with XRE-family HTH domain